jgi:hypothetical protein
MRVPLAVVAIPLLILGVFGIFVSPDTAMQFLERLPSYAPIKIRLASMVPWVFGNRSLGAVAMSCLLYIVLRQVSDFFDKS